MNSAPVSFLRGLASLLRQPARLPRLLLEYAGIRRGGLFNAGYYRASYPDVERGRIDPLLHYVVYGAGEGRDPHPLFDSRFYLERNPEVARRGRNPFWHFSSRGLRERRDPGPFFSFALLSEEYPAGAGAGSTGARRLLAAAAREAYPRQSPFAYRCWLHAYADLLDSGAAAEPARPGTPDTPTLLSVVTVVNRATPAAALRQTLRSLAAQPGGQWECIVALAPDAPPDCVELLRAHFFAGGPPGSAVPADHSAICDLLNAAVARCSGRAFLVLDPGDALAASAVPALVAALDADAQALVVYSDEDRLDAAGRRCDPRFKPPWSREFFLAGNYLGRAVAVDRAAAAAAGGFREDAEPAHEYDLLLRILEGGYETRVRHLPRVLCHRPLAAPAAPGLAEAARRAVEGHLRRLGDRGTVVEVRGHCNRVTYPLPSSPPLVSVVVPTRDRLPLLRTCLQSLARTAYPCYEVLVVDNDSRDPQALAYLWALASPLRVLRHEGPFNFSLLNNLAVREARGEVLVFLNNDTEVVDPAWLDELVRLAVRPGIGAVGARLLFPDRTVQHAGVVLGVDGVAGNAFVGLPASDEGYLGQAAVTREVTAVSAACLAVRREVFDAAGGFDAAAFPVDFNDVDLCLRIRALGLKNLLCATAELLHHESASRANLQRTRDRRAEATAFAARWPDPIADDPCYNPNLSLRGRPFELAAPPRLQSRTR